MQRNLFLKTLFDQRKAILAWGLGLGSLAYLSLLFFPSLSTNPQYDLLIQSMSRELMAFLGNVQSVSTIGGYLTYGLLSYLPLVLAFFAIPAAAGLISCEIESGTMDFVLSQPIPRWRVVLEKYAALATALVAVCLLFGLCMWLGGLTIRSDVGLSTWLVAGLNIVPLTLFFGSVAFALACATRGRGVAIATASGLAVASFVLNGLVPLSEDLQPYAHWTLYYWYSASRPFEDGIILGHVAILLGGCLLCLGLALFAFQHRDILA